MCIAVSVERSRMFSPASPNPQDGCPFRALLVWPEL